MMGWLRRREKAPPEDEWVVVAWARHEPEADLIANLLRDNGVPAYHRRAMGLDVPDFLAMGQRVVLVRRDDSALAREIIEPIVEPDPPDIDP